MLKSSPRATDFNNLMIPERDEEYDRQVTGPKMDQTIENTNESQQWNLSSMSENPSMSSYFFLNSAKRSAVTSNYMFLDRSLSMSTIALFPLL